MSDDVTRQPAEDPVISVGVLAARVGLSVSAVRKYENEGLVIAHRTEGGRLLFCHEDIARVRHIHHLIREVGLTIEAIRRLQALVPCWDLLPCGPEMRDRCPAYCEPARPCWSMKGLTCACQGNACRQCVVYRMGSMCADDVKHLVYGHCTGDARGSPVQELLERRDEVRSNGGVAPPR